MILGHIRDDGCNLMRRVMTRSRLYGRCYINRLYGIPPIENVCCLKVSFHATKSHCSILKYGIIIRKHAEPTMLCHGTEYDHKPYNNLRLHFQFYSNIDYQPISRAITSS